MFVYLGKLFWANGDLYEGEYQDGNKNGSGKDIFQIGFILIKFI